MDGMLVPIFVAGSVASLVWAIIVVVAGAGRGERKKLSQRLSIESRVDPVAGQGHRPITVQTEVRGVPRFLAARPFIQVLNRRVLHVHPGRSLGRFLLTAAVYGGVAGALTLLVTASYTVGLAVAAAGLYLPFMMLNMSCNRRQREIGLQLPEALDFLTRVLRAGHSLTTGLQMAGEELPQPLSGEFRKAYDQQSLGVSLEDALRETAVRIESGDFAFFVTAVLIQRQTGGDLSEVLTNISSMIRGRVRLAQHVRAKTAEGRFSGYVLVAFPAVMFLLSYYMNPGYAGILLHDSGGRMLLGTAVALQIMGLFAIRKITTLKV